MFSVIPVICKNCIGFVENPIVGVRVFLTSVIVVVVIAGPTRVVLALVLLVFELTALVSIVTWLFAVVTSWFGFFWVLLCGLLRHSIYLQCIWGFQAIPFQIPFKM